MGKSYVGVKSLDVDFSIEPKIFKCTKGAWKGIYIECRKSATEPHYLFKFNGLWYKRLGKKNRFKFDNSLWEYEKDGFLDESLKCKENETEKSKYSKRDVENQIMRMLFCDRLEWWKDQLDCATSKTVCTLGSMLRFRISNVDMLILCSLHMGERNRNIIELLLNVCNRSIESEHMHREHYDKITSEFML